MQSNTHHYRPYKETSCGSKLVSSIVDPFVRTGRGARALIDIARNDDSDDSAEERMYILVYGCCDVSPSKQLLDDRLVNFTTASNTIRLMAIRLKNSALHGRLDERKFKYC